jgi:hypothetical protein
MALGICQQKTESPPFFVPASIKSRGSLIGEAPEPYSPQRIIWQIGLLFPAAFDNLGGKKPIFHKKILSSFF